MFWNPSHSNMHVHCICMSLSFWQTAFIWFIWQRHPLAWLVRSHPSPLTCIDYQNFSRPKIALFYWLSLHDFCVFAWNSNNFVETIVTIFEITNVRLKLWQMWSYFQTTQISSEFVSPIIGLQFDGSFSARLVHLSGRL